MSEANVPSNPVVLQMRKIYCCKGAQFAAPELEAGWKEIERLECVVNDLTNQLKSPRYRGK